MEEIKVKAIIINSTDYKDKHKIVNAYSLEEGLISFILKNCKSAKSKLKFCHSPFCFLELELFKNEEVITLKTATVLDDFFSISENYDAFITASAILEIVLKGFKQNEKNELLFLNLLKFLKMLAYSSINPLLILTRFLIGITKISGYKLNFDLCQNCHFPYKNSVYLNLNTGEFECEACKQNFSVQIENSLFNFLNKISKLPVENLIEIETDDKRLLDCIKLLTLNLEARLNCKLNYKKNFD